MFFYMKNTFLNLVTVFASWQNISIETLIKYVFYSKTNLSEIE